MDSEVRHIRQDGQPLLEDFLCEAVSVPDGVRTAVLDDADAVYDLVQRDIRAIYPSCYEPTIVEAFCRLHSRDAIATDIGGGKICVLEADGNIVATGTPEDVAKVEGSFTGAYLKKVLQQAKDKGQME